MNVQIEFIGISRLLTGTSKLSLMVDSSTTYQDLLKKITGKFPALVGQVVKPESFEFYPSNMFSLDGKRMIKPQDMNQSCQDGDRLIVMSILAGG